MWSESCECASAIFITTTLCYVDLPAWMLRLYLYVFALLLQVLQTGDEIAELDQSGFYTQETTVWAGNIGQKKYNVQVWCGVLVLV